MTGLTLREDQGQDTKPVRAPTDEAAGGKLRVLVVTRVFSGLADSLHSGDWDPRGVPAVYRFIEGLARRSDLDVTYVFLAREIDERFRKVRWTAMPPLGERVCLLPFRSWLGASRIGRIFKELEQTLRVLAIALRLRPNVVYCTNAAFVQAALLARLRIAPVILRFLGIFPIHTRLAEARGPAIVRWLYRSPFARVVCTLEGSGGEHRLPSLLGNGVRCDTLLNGVDRRRADPGIGAELRRRYGLDDNPVIGFLGRLEPYKGAEQFVEALIRLQAIRPGRFKGLVIGGGSMSDHLAEMIRRANMQSRIRLVRSVPHHEVADHLAILDIYISLNRYGNLSNANLEAMTAGLCSIFLEGEPDQHIDAVTARLVPEEIVARVSRTDTVDRLVGVLAKLIDDPAEVRRRASATATLASRLVMGWNERIERELEMLTAEARLDPPPKRLQRRAVVQ